MAHHETAVSRPRQQVARRHVLMDQTQEEANLNSAAGVPRRAEAEAARHLKGPPQNP